MPRPNRQTPHPTQTPRPKSDTLGLPDAAAPQQVPVAILQQSVAAPDPAVLALARLLGRSAARAEVAQHLKKEEASTDGPETDETTRRA